MLRKLMITALFAFALACGGEPAIEPSPEPEAPVAKAKLTDTVKPTKAAAPKKASPVSSKGSASDPLVQTREAPPGDLAFVFTNNVDGEIEPCG